MVFRGFFSEQYFKTAPISAVYFLLIVSFAVSAANPDYWALNFSTSKKFQYHYRQSFNKGWRFYQGNPSGTPSATTFDDGSWQKVNVPHSPSYDAPDKSNFYLGPAWYRKKFALPANVPAGKKVFIEFRGTMSTAQVWVNGTQAGSHENGGYTCFVIDISNQVSRTDSSVIAVKVDNSPQADVPPGAGWVDYVTFGGMYRNTWLHITDPVYIPEWGQIISTPTVTAGSATVKVNTTVVNSKAQQSACSVTYNIFDKNNAQVSTQTAQQTIPVNGRYTFLMTSEIPTPAIWTLTTPNLYKIVTTVSVDGTPVDDYIDRFGVRTLAWSKDSGCILNGKRFFINGANLAQDMGWVHAAVPVSRFYKMVESLKYAGFNLMRCSHFPRDPSFYEACDELGLLLVTEAPTWGHSHTSYSSLFWTRLLGAFKEMVVQGNNHPSIIGYGYFNEPGGNFSTYYAQMKMIADSINPGLFKYLTNNPYQSYELASIDFYGNQYSGYPSTLPALATEYLGFSGATRGDQAAEDKYFSDAQGQLQNCKNDKKNAGGVLWCFRDYWGFGDGGGTNTLHDSKLGIVDQCYVPKRSYYAYHKLNVGVSDDDNSIQGTATKVSLEPDLTSLRADGSDISLVIIAIRDNNGKCITSNAPVTLALSGTSCTLFGPTTVNVVAGKLGVVVRSTEVVGATAITATSGSLASGTTTITTYPAVDNSTSIKPPQAVKAIATHHATIAPVLCLSGNGTPRFQIGKGKSIQAYDVMGHLVLSEEYSVTSSKLRHVRPGVYVLKVKKTGKE
jgi:hypothetical protein